MIGLPAYLRIVRASAWYDLVATAGFATPWTFALVLAGLRQLAQWLGMPAGFPPFAPEHMLMANLLGALVTVWAVLRLGRYDAVGRCLFATLMLVALVHGAHPIVWGFFVMEVAFGLLQMIPVAHLQEQTGPGSRQKPAGAGAR